MVLIAKHEEYGEITASNAGAVAVFLGVDYYKVVECANRGLSIQGWVLSWDDDLPEEFPDDDDTMDLDDEESWNRKI